MLEASLIFNRYALLLHHILYQYYMFYNKYCRYSFIRYIDVFQGVAEVNKYILLKFT